VYSFVSLPNGIRFIRMALPDKVEAAILIDSTVADQVHG
jgi:hypothetical protein